MKETVATLKAELDAFKRRQRWWQVAFVVAVVVFAVLLVTVFKPKETKGEGVIQADQRVIEALERNNSMIDSLLKTKDVEYKANRPAETRIKTKYEQIPAAVRDLNREQLRREVAEY